MRQYHLIIKIVKVNMSEKKSEIFNRFYSTIFNRIFIQQAHERIPTCDNMHQNESQHATTSIRTNPNIGQASERTPRYDNKHQKEFQHTSERIPTCNNKHQKESQHTTNSTTHQNESLHTTSGIRRNPNIRQHTTTSIRTNPNIRQQASEQIPTIRIRIRKSGIFNGFFSRLFKRQQASEQIVREETFCHLEAQRRKMNIIVKNLPEQEGVDDVTQVKQIIQNQLQLPVPTILKATRLGEKKPTTQNSVSRYQPLLIQLPESEIALKRQIVQMSYVKRKSLQTFFRNDVPKRFRTAGSSYAIMYQNGVEQLVVLVNLSQEYQKTN
ncbi:hypothetical protein QYM36_009606 [Artemia franciscana]|uniref:Uncharacterized protein n=1 Tax=Artemia franciscana TaxID=6661 RepID=A0AA88KZU6_ARTSF|nr:hypothetical protein QYM36_009508 [Artemia franciscana]KAK2713780.1 hypothetical protein QYM36_009606 [Artemia franciscana]